MSDYPSKTGVPKELENVPYWDSAHPAFTWEDRLGIIANSGHPPLPIEINEKVRAAFPRLHSRSLIWLAEQLGKSARTIRRYCEAGLIPGAYRSRGRHWRVTCGLKKLAKIRKSIAAFERKSRGKIRLPKTAHEISFSKQLARDESSKISEPNIPAILTAYDFEAALHGQHHAYMTKEITAGRQKIDTDDARWKLAKTAAHKDSLAVMVATAAKRMANLNTPLSMEEIARTVGLSRSTIYRKLGAAKFRRIARESYY